MSIHKLHIRTTINGSLDIWWQNRFLVECTLPVVDITLSVQPTPYDDVLKLDRDIRNFDVPLALQMVDDVDHQPPLRPLGMQQALIASSRLCSTYPNSHITYPKIHFSTALLHLHRSYFTVALTSNEMFTVQHTYTPSVLAVYSGCCSIISTIATIYQWEPELSTRYTIYWNNLFSAAVSCLRVWTFLSSLTDHVTFHQCALCFLVSRAPDLPIAPNALQELDRISHLFTKVRSCCPKVASYYVSSPPK